MGGKTSTHVYNSYEYTVYVKCDSEKMTSTESNFQFEAKTSAGHENDISLGKSKENKDLDNQDSNLKFESKANVGAGMNFSTKSERRLIEVGFTKILPGRVVRFDVNCTGTKHVYITIYDQHGNLLCESQSKCEDKSIIIDTGGQVVDTKYHKKFIAVVPEMQPHIKPPAYFAPKK